MTHLTDPHRMLRRFFLAALVAISALLPQAVFAQLTAAQLVTLKAAIAANPVLSAMPRTADTAYYIAAEMSKPASPAYIVWKTAVSRDEVGKAFVATALAAITAGNNDKLANFAAWNDSVNPSRSDQRAFFDDIFGVAAGVSTRAALLVLWKRPARECEKLFATGTGTDAAPSTLTYEGGLNYADIYAAWGV